MWEQFLDTLKINPEHGDWTAALLTAFIFLIQSVFFMFKNFSESKEKRIIEEKELYQDMKHVYNELWLALTSYSPKILYCEYSNREQMAKLAGEDSEKIRTYVYQIIDTLADIYFMYYSRESRYWKRWESIIEYVFSKKLFYSAWKTLRTAFIKREPHFVEYVDLLIQKQANKSIKE